MNVPLVLVFILLIPLAAAGLALIHQGLGRSRSAAHAMLATLCAMGVAAIVLSVLAVILTQLAAKGTLTWSQYAHQSSNTRIGVYVLLVGYLLTLVAGIMQTRRRA